MSNSRAVAAQIISRVLVAGVSLTDAFDESLQDISSSRDRGFVQELCYGVLRWYGPLKQLCAYLLKKPLSPADQDIYALLLTGLYQLNYLKTSPHAAVHETVQAARELNKSWAVPLINGVLRSFQRQQISLLKKMPEDIHYAHPKWLLKRLQQAWPNEWQAIIAANNHVPSMSLRINFLKNKREDYAQKLRDKNITAQLSDLSKAGIILDESCNVFKLPGFSEGEVSIQDTAAQLAAFLLMLQAGQRVLDACAAPGGKTSHILETQPDLLSCIVVDKDAIRLNKVKDNLTRLGLADDKVQLLCAKAEELKSSWKRELLDRILLDAPCSGTGVICKHPDIKLLRREEDIVKLAEQQYQLLSGLWPLLKPDGILLYVTCSVLPEENSDVLVRFLSQYPDAKEEIIDAKWGVACPIGRQIFPQLHGTDGFYYARLRKMDLQ
ncbi:MAG: ribosomal small subunit methyltransferase [Pseudomonadota bacterium]|jgi:16S rRNA (cytosine967-C5)-methyltransferase